jgi:hypothetical protein
MSGPKQTIVAILKSFEQEMENYSYFGSNPGVSENDYEGVADKIIESLALVTPDATEKQAACDHVWVGTSLNYWCPKCELKQPFK